MKRLILGALAVAFAMLGAPALAATCPSYPYTLANGQTADATQVMANFNSILSCANTNVARAGANSDITSLSGLLTPLSLSQGGTGNTTGQPSGAAGGALTGSYPNPTIPATIVPFDFYTFVGGLTGNAWILAAFNPSTSVILTTGASHCAYGTAATSSTTYTLKDNNSAIGTAVFTSGGCTMTITSSPYTVTAGHALSLVGPTTGDATLADIGMTFSGTRN